MEVEENGSRPMIHPGPIDPSVLTLQTEHRSTNIWAGEEYNYIWCRRADAPLHRVEGRGAAPPLDDRIMRYIIEAGFYGVYRLGFIRLDHALINALVERWRQETHTFHFPIGEATVTLQDVGVLLGLPIDGDAVTGVDDSLKSYEWQRVCEELLGVTPPLEQFASGRLKLQWLVSQFRWLPEGANEDTIQCHARAHILALIGGVIVPDRSGNLVKLMYLPLLRDLDKIGTYSWGSATLACLYREMCRATHIKTKEIGGCLVLLQLWAWERLRCFQPLLIQNTEHPPHDVEQASGDPFPHGPRGCRWCSTKNQDDVPDHVLTIYRDQLDQLKEDQFLWQPYDLQRLPAYCLQGRAVWMTRSPLVCFERVEWHFPDRVLRQFGILQTVPVPCDTGTTLHRVDRRGRTRVDWKAEHGQFIELWNQRAKTLADGVPLFGRVGYTHPYMVWYRECTRLIIGNPSHRVHSGYRAVAGIIEGLTQHLQHIYVRCEEAVGEYDPEEIIGDIRRLTAEALGLISEHERSVTQPSASGQAPTEQQELTTAKIPAKKRPRGPKRQHLGTSTLGTPPSPRSPYAAVLPPSPHPSSVPTNSEASVPTTPNSYVLPSPLTSSHTSPASPPFPATSTQHLLSPRLMMSLPSDIQQCHIPASDGALLSPPPIGKPNPPHNLMEVVKQDDESSQVDISTSVTVSGESALQSSTSDDAMEAATLVVPAADTSITSSQLCSTAAEFGEEPAPNRKLMETEN